MASSSRFSEVEEGKITEIIDVMRQWAAGCESDSCELRRRRGGERAENSLKLTGLDISFEMPRILAAGSLYPEILWRGNLGCVSLGFVIQDHMDSLRPKKRNIHCRIIFVTFHEIMLIYEIENGCWNLRLNLISMVHQDLWKLYSSEVFGNLQYNLEDFHIIVSEKHFIENLPWSLMILS